MERKDFKDKMILITYGIVLFVVLMNISKFTSVLEFISNIIAPFITGAIMAFILNVLVNLFEIKVYNKLSRAKRGLSVFSSLVTVIAFIAFILIILIPQIKNAGSIFLENLPEYQENIYSIGEKIGLSPEKIEIFNIGKIDWKKKITTLVSDNSDYIVKFSMGFANSLIGVVTNGFIGLIFCIYILLDKDNLKRQFCLLFNKIFKKDVYDKLLLVSRISNQTFGNFVKVQFLEAFILGFLCFIGMMLFGLPYAATISVLVGFTALIPIFGAFIGCIIGAFLIFMVNPIQSLIFILFFLILQQIEGNFIYPKVVGGKIGLPSIWVLVAVIIGGSLGGVLGMLLGVPFVSVIYSLLRIYVRDNNIQVVKKKKVGGKSEKTTTN